MASQTDDELRIDLDLDPESRSAAIAAFGLQGGLETKHLDDICAFVAQDCGTPIALISLVDEQEQRFLGRSGTSLRASDRSTSFCATTMVGHGPLIVPDAMMDPRFREYSLVTGPPHLRFYAGVPLVTPEGVPIGALCVLDDSPHPQGLQPRQIDLLMLMATSVMDHLLLRRAQLEGAAAAFTAARALDESELRFRVLADAMPHMVWSARPDGFSDYFNAAWCDFTGEPEAASHGNRWTRFLHPDDLLRTAEVWRESVEAGSTYDIEYRLRRCDGKYRWILARGLPMRDANGDIVRWFGTCTDMHEQKLALEQRDIISQELSHRIKNIFAVISGLIGLSAREHPELRAMTDSLRERILALGRAHDFVRPHSHESRPTQHQQDSLAGLLAQIFAPYTRNGLPRIRIAGEDVQIDDRSATPLALLFHEIATNAAKYGALSVPEGSVELHIGQLDRMVTMHWHERDGPPVQIPREDSAGFGSKLLDLSVRRQLGGDFVQRFGPDGLDMTISIPLSAFSRQRVE